jgi:uncharacterized protein (DUF362 family)
VYGWPKNVLHWAGIDESIADIHSLFPNTFAIVDGIIGMEGNGPVQGTPKPAGVLVAGSNLVAVDHTCCRLMGIDPAKIRYLQLASGGVFPHINEAGESVERTKLPFQLIPEMQNRRVL